jgi:hypothetical protein
LTRHVNRREQTSEVFVATIRSGQTNHAKTQTALMYRTHVFLLHYIPHIINDPVNIAFERQMYTRVLIYMTNV